MKYLIILSFIFLSSCSLFVKEKIIYIEKPMPIKILCERTIKPNFDVDDLTIEQEALQLGINIDKLKAYAKSLNVEIQCIYESIKKIDEKSKKELLQ